MPQSIAFLRGINLGNRRVKMTDLKSIFEELDFEEVSTFIASGNVVFSSKAKDAAKLEVQIEKKLAASLGYEVETHLRTAAELAAVGEFDPFPDEPWEKSNWTIHVAFHKTPIARSEARKIEAIRTDYDAFRVQGRELYWLTHGGISASTVWKLPEVKSIKLPSNTLRNRSTLLKMIEKYAFA
jgi:uncharacterized protein (DUF1697 family)